MFHASLTRRVARSDDQASRRRSFQPRLLALEDRALPSTFTVQNLHDGGAGSLRAAINAANAHSGADTIAFAGGVHGTIALTSGELDLSDSVAINGPGENRLIVSGNNASRVFSVSGSSTSVDLSGLTVANGLATDDTLPSPFGFELTEGGGLFVNAAHVALSNVTFTNDQAVGVASAGGAIAVAFGASLSASHATFNDNSAQGALLGVGGAIIADAGSALVVDHASFTGNTTIAQLGSSLTNPFQGAGLGGAIAVGGGSTASLTHLDFMGNLATGGSGAGDLGGPGDGGALFLTADSLLVLPVSSSAILSHDSFSNNRALGGDGTDGSSGFVATDGGEGLGGAIRDAGSFLTVSDSTFEGNRAVGGRGGKGAPGGRGGAGGDSYGGAVQSVINDLPFAQIAATMNLAHSCFTDNIAEGGAGGMGGADGNGGNGGLGAGGGIRAGFGALTLTDSLILDNLARGGAGGAKGLGGATGGDGGDGLGGGLHTGGLGFPSMVTIVFSVLADNDAVGGAGNAGANGGNGQGGGVFGDFDSTLTLSHTLVTLNQARGGSAGAGGSVGDGLGGGIFNLGDIILGPGTLVRGNHATTGYDDCFGC